MDRDGADLVGLVPAGGGQGAGGAANHLPRPVRGVVFDLDGTLLDTEPAYRRAFYAALTEAGHTLPAGAYDQLVGLPSTTRRKLLPEILGPGFDAGLFFHSYYRHRSLLSAGGVAIKAGAVSLLDQLAEAGIPCAVATSASAATAAAQLTRSGLASRFAAVVSRDDVAAGKPAPDSFLAAASRMNVAPASCLALEDSDHGVRAASDAAMMVVMVPDTVVPSADALSRCCAVVGSLQDVAGLMDRELAGVAGRCGGRGKPRKKGLLF